MRLERLIGEIGFPNSSNQLPFWDMSHQWRLLQSVPCGQRQSPSHAAGMVTTQAWSRINFHHYCSSKLKPHSSVLQVAAILPTHPIILIGKFWFQTGTKVSSAIHLTIRYHFPLSYLFISPWALARSWSVLISTAYALFQLSCLNRWTCASSVG
jgi:hypothetical protein